MMFNGCINGSARDWFAQGNVLLQCFWSFDGSLSLFLCFLQWERLWWLFDIFGPFFFWFCKSSYLRKRQYIGCTLERYWTTPKATASFYLDFFIYWSFGLWDSSNWLPLWFSWWSWLEVGTIQFNWISKWCGFSACSLCYLIIIYVFQNLNHKNIVKYLGSLKTRSHLHIILE